MTLDYIFKSFSRELIFELKQVESAISSLPWTDFQKKMGGKNSSPRPIKTVFNPRKIVFKINSILFPLYIITFCHLK